MLLSKWIEFVYTCEKCGFTYIFKQELLTDIIPNPPPAKCLRCEGSTEEDIKTVYIKEAKDGFDVSTNPFNVGDIAVSLNNLYSIREDEVYTVIESMGNNIVIDDGLGLSKFHYSLFRKKV